jgi:hypothetical protein
MIKQARRSEREVRSANDSSSSSLKPNRTNFCQILRNTVQHQIDKFREYCYINYIENCSMCQVNLLSTRQPNHVDHIVQFKDLVDTFLTTHEIQIGESLPDERITTLFNQFHEKHAELRLTCATCNLARNKKKSIKTAQ